MQHVQFTTVLAACDTVLDTAGRTIPVYNEFASKLCVPYTPEMTDIHVKNLCSFI